MTPGTYRLKAELTGFKSAAREGVVVTVETTTRLDLKLEVGAFTETIVVDDDSALDPMIEHNNSTMGVVIDHKKLVDLPLHARNFTQLGTLTPGVVAPPTALGGQRGRAHA